MQQRSYVLGVLIGVGAVGAIGAVACGGSDTSAETVYVDGGVQIVQAEAGTPAATPTRKSAIDVDVTTAEDTPVTVDLKTTEGTKAATFKIVAQPAHGTLGAPGADGKVTYTPAANYSGLDYFRFATTDDQGDGPTATAWINVTPVNDVPVGSSVTVTAYPGATIPIDLGGSDVDHDAASLTFAIAGQPGKGSATLAGNRVSYTANANATGSDTFTFTASDGSGTSTATTVTINIVLPKDCLELRNAGVSKSTVYKLDADGAGAEAPFDAYCEMQRNGGGWTLALKVDGSSNQFHYGASAWTDTTTVNDTAPDFDVAEAKLASFNLLPVSEVMLGMLPLGSFDAGLIDAGDGGIASQSWRFVTTPVTATSLQDLFANGGYVPTSIGRAGWKQLVDDSSLQYHCNREGFNVPNPNIPGAVIRLGIVGNNEDECNSPDSYIGIGRQAGPLCAASVANYHTAGNYNYCAGSDNGGRGIKTYAALFVRNAEVAGDFTSLAAEASCKAHLDHGHSKSGKYLVKAVAGDAGADAGPPVAVYCDMTTQGGGWTLGFVTNSAANVSRAGFGASLLNTDQIANHPAARSVDRTGVVASLDLNAFPYTELEIAAYFQSAEHYRSASIAKSDLRIAFGQDGYLLWGDKNGYYWCGGVHAYTDNGVGQVNKPTGAPDDCKGHGGLWDGWDFSFTGTVVNQGLTLGGTGVWMSGGFQSFNQGFNTAYPNAGVAQAIWVR